MARKRKGELPSGNVRKQIYAGTEIVRDEYGTIIIDPKTGKPKKKRKYISVTSSSTKEAELMKSQVKMELAENKSRTIKNITLYDAIDEYIDSREQLGKSPTTIQDYRIIQKNAFKDIMFLPIAELDEELLQDAVNIESKRTNRKRTVNPKPISAKRLKNEWGLIASTLKKYRPDINTAAIELPHCVDRVVELPSAERVISIVKGTDIELAVLLAAWLSFSISEIRGLTKSKSISSDGNYIRINEVMVTVDNKPVIKEIAKNPTRNRKHRIPDYIKVLIQQVDGDYLVPMSGIKVYKEWIKLQKANDMSPITFHDLRHLNASVMALLHIPDKYAQERGGWKTDDVMKKVYTQTFAEERVKVDDKMDSYFNNLVYNETDQDNEKYRTFLQLFNLVDSDSTRAMFNQLNSQN